MCILDTADWAYRLEPSHFRSQRVKADHNSLSYFSFQNCLDQLKAQPSFSPLDRSLRITNARIRKALPLINISFSIIAGHEIGMNMSCMAVTETGKCATSVFLCFLQNDLVLNHEGLRSIITLLLPILECI